MPRWFKIMHWASVALVVVASLGFYDISQAQVTSSETAPSSSADATGQDLTPTSTPNAADLAAAESADSEALFMAAAKLARQKRLEDAAYMFYIAQIRAGTDLESYEPVGTGGNSPGVAIAAIQFELGQVINPAIMRDRDAFGRVVDRIESFACRFSPTYSPGWEYRSKVDETSFNAVTTEIKTSRQQQMRDFRRLLADDEYYRLFRLTQSYHCRHYDRLPWEMFGGEPEERQVITAEECTKAVTRLKEIEQQMGVTNGPFSDDKRATRKRKPEYKITSSGVVHHGRRIAGADPASFVVLDEVDYAKDNHRVYVRGFEIPGADPKTFRVLGGPYARDNAKLYCGTLTMPPANTERFEVVLSSSTWSETNRDSLTSEYLADEFAESLAATPPIRDEVVVTGDAWARDGVHYFYGPTRVVGADYASFEIIDEFRARDKSSTFHGHISENKAEQPQPATFPQP